eukprot:COSAG05_NODE_11_length_38500_cov_831.349861_6_plen_93_part_00
MFKDTLEREMTSVLPHMLPVRCLTPSPASRAGSSRMDVVSCQFNNKKKFIRVVLRLDGEILTMTEVSECQLSPPLTHSLAQCPCTLVLTIVK